MRARLAGSLAPMQGNRNSRARRAGALAGIAALAPLAALASAEHANADQIQITNRHQSGKGSFAEAVRLANKGHDRDLLVFSSRLSGSIRTRGATFDDAVALRSKGSVTLNGRGRHANLSFNGENTKSHPGPASSVRDLRIRDMGIRVGDYAGMSISGVTLRGGSSEPAFGVYTNYYDDVSIRRSTISGFKFGVANYRSDVVVGDSVVSGNGVGVTNGYAGTEIVQSTITGNSEYGVEAGYYGDADLRDSTVADNGGVGVFGDVEVYNSTVTGNNGAAESYDGDAATFVNSIVTGNKRSGGGPECGADAPRSLGGNLFGPACAALATKKDVVAKDARLGPLKDNGGPTPTVALKRGSPAIGLATDKATKKDQRGVPRGKDPDSGAYERSRKHPG